jgi:hypothetical protein
LTAWRIPPVWKNLQANDLVVPENSSVPQNQKKMLKATSEVLTAIAKDVRIGLLETVGVESTFSMDEGAVRWFWNCPHELIRNSSRERLIWKMSKRGATTRAKFMWG